MLEVWKSVNNALREPSIEKVRKLDILRSCVKFKLDYFWKKYSLDFANHLFALYVHYVGIVRKFSHKQFSNAKKGILFCGKFWQIRLGSNK